jgi:hypothetical protein
MKYIILFLVGLVASPSFSQMAATAPVVSVAQDPKTMTLQDRYVNMKKTAETYQDYKVIKEGVLDGVWRVFLDSMKSQKAKFATSTGTIARLESELATEKVTVKQVQDSVQEITFDSTHISFFGLSFTKSLFVTLVLLIVSGLLFALGAIIGKLKLMNSSINEKTETVNILTHEFEDYKKRALEKQVKLSRELQTERNKLSNFESKGSSKSVL